MKKLPLGIQTFRNIIEEKYLYIDKTKELTDLISTGKYYFLSRPRRFGKSLLLSTLKEIFLGSRDLFKGLFIHDKIEWTPHPVIHFDFSTIDYENLAQLKKSLITKLDDLNKLHCLEIEENSLKIYFEKIIAALHKKYSQKVVVLVDEYDKPIIDFISQQEKAQENRDLLRNFFSVLKGAEQYLRFVFLTGVTKFNKVSIFSGLNNIRDITLTEKFSTLLGITKEELTHYFKDRITQFSAHENISETTLLEKIRHWYNGYSWNGKDRVYNPTSLLNLFENNKFGNYWFATGTPTFLIKTIKEYGYEITEIEETQVGEYILDSYDIENIDITALLFQTGYLTINRVVHFEGDYSYVLTCPNHEVKHSLINYLISDFTNTPLSKVAPQYIKLKKALKTKDLDTFITLIRSIFAKIPYNLRLPDESYYHSLFYLLLSLVGVKINLEVLTDKGRIDGVLELDDMIYIIELKRGTPQNAMDQINHRRYYEPYLDSGKEIFLLGVGGFDDKNIEYICKQIKG